jgi:hypothetical protein
MKMFWNKFYRLGITFIDLHFDNAQKWGNIKKVHTET